MRKYYHADLSDEQIAILKFLRQEVDRCADEDRKFDREDNSQQRLWYARDPGLPPATESGRSVGAGLTSTASAGASVYLTWGRYI